MILTVVVLPDADPVNTVPPSKVESPTTPKSPVMLVGPAMSKVPVTSVEPDNTVDSNTVRFLTVRSSISPVL